MLPQEAVPVVEQPEEMSGIKARSLSEVTPNADRMEAADEPARATSIAATASMARERQERQNIRGTGLLRSRPHGYILGDNDEYQENTPRGHGLKLTGEQYMMVGTDQNHSCVTVFMLEEADTNR